MYYVTTRHAFYCWNYDNELSILNWIIYSFDFPMEMNDIDADSEFDPLLPYPQNKYHPHEFLAPG